MFNSTSPDKNNINNNQLNIIIFFSIVSLCAIIACCLVPKWGKYSSISPVLP